MIGALRRAVRRSNLGKELFTDVRVLSTVVQLERKGLYELLTKEEEALMAEQLSITERAKDIASRIGKVKMRDTRFLENLLPNQKSNFSIVVAGEFNAGKSSLINALIGNSLLDTGALPTTDAITILTKSDTRSTTNLQGGLIWHQVESIPQGIILVDTPGTNAVVVDHTSRTVKLLPTADLILFCTSADRPFPESERKLLQSIQAYRKNIIVVINKIDILDASGGAYGREEKDKVVNFVTDNASTLLGSRPVVISVSSKDALSSKLMGNPNLWERSNFQELETFLKESLTTETKIKAKLLNPLGVAEGVLVEGLQILAQEENDLESDIATLKLLNHQFESWTKEMDADMKVFCADIRDELEMEGTRLNRLIKKEGVISLMWWCLFNQDRWESEWRQSMAKGSMKELESELLERIHEMASTIATRSQAQGQAVVDYLGKRPSIINKNILGNVVAASQFEDVRKTLHEQMHKSITASTINHDEFAMKRYVEISLKQAAIIAIGLEGSALACFGLSYLEMIDLLYGGGLGCASALLGTLISTTTSSSISRRYSNEMINIGTEMHTALEAVWTKQMKRLTHRILDGVQPYSRYVHTEKDRIQKMTKESENTLSEAQAVRSRINKLRHYD